MGGAPFQAVKHACLLLSDSIFGNTPEDNCFSKVHLVFYCHVLHSTLHTSRESFNDEVNKAIVTGGTDFNICFSYIEKSIKKVPVGSGIQVIFLTDGQGSNQNKENLKNLLQREMKERDV